MLSQLINRPCTITRRGESGEQDDYGNEEPSVAQVDTVCDIQQVRRTELDDAEVSDTTWLLFLPPDTAIDTGDQVTIDDTGETFEMAGDPWPVRNPRTGVESHVEATVRRVAGDFDGDAS